MVICLKISPSPRNTSRSHRLTYTPAMTTSKHHFPATPFVSKRRLLAPNSLTPPDVGCTVGKPSQSRLWRRRMPARSRRPLQRFKGRYPAEWDPRNPTAIPMRLVLAPLQWGDGSIEKYRRAVRERRTTAFEWRGAGRYFLRGE